MFKQMQLVGLLLGQREQLVEVLLRVAHRLGLQLDGARDPLLLPRHLAELLLVPLRQRHDARILLAIARAQVRQFLPELRSPRPLLR